MSQKYGKDFSSNHNWLEDSLFKRIVVYNSLFLAILKGESDVPDFFTTIKQAEDCLNFSPMYKRH